MPRRADFITLHGMVAFLVGARTLDDIALPVAAFALVWIFFNQLSSRKNVCGAVPSHDAGSVAGKK